MYHYTHLPQVRPSTPQIFEFVKFVPTIKPNFPKTRPRTLSPTMCDHLTPMPIPTRGKKLDELASNELFLSAPPYYQFRRVSVGSGRTAKSSSAASSYTDYFLDSFLGGPGGGGGPSSGDVTDERELAHRSENNTLTFWPPPLLLLLFSQGKLGPGLPLVVGLVVSTSIDTSVVDLALILV